MPAAQPIRMVVPNTHIFVRDLCFMVFEAFGVGLVAEVGIDIRAMDTGVTTGGPTRAVEHAGSSTRYVRTAANVEVEF